MDRIMPIVVAFALGAVAASMVQFPTQGWSLTADGDHATMISPLETAVRYPLPPDVAGLRVIARN